MIRTGDRVVFTEGVQNRRGERREVGQAARVTFVSRDGRRVDVRWGGTVDPDGGNMHDVPIAAVRVVR